MRRIIEYSDLTCQYPYWTSGLNGFLILLGSALLADNGFTLAAAANRVWQIVLATAYVSFAFAVLAMFRERFIAPDTAASEADR
jgi:hypothetical protein